MPSFLSLLDTMLVVALHLLAVTAKDVLGDGAVATLLIGSGAEDEDAVVVVVAIGDVADVTSELCTVGDVANV